MVHFVRRLFSMVLSRLDAAVYARNSFTVAPRISSGFLSQPDGFSSLTVSDVWVTFSAAHAGAGNVYLLKDSAPAFVDIVSLRAGLPSDLMCSSMMMVSMGEQSHELSGCALTHSQSYKVYVYVANSQALTDGTLSAGLPATVVPGHSNYFTQVPQLANAGLTTSGFTVSFSVATAGVAWVIAIPAVEATSASVMTVTSGYSAICSSLGVALPSSGSHAVAVTGCSFIASWSYAVLVYVTNQAAGNDGALSPPVPLQITPSNNFAVLPYLSEVPSPDMVKAKFMGTAAGKAWACIVKAENVSDVTVSDVKAGCAGCSSGEAMLSDTQELEVNMTGCNLEVGVEHRLIAYAEDNNNADDGYMTMNLAVRVPTSNAFISPAYIVNNMVTAYGCTVMFEVANTMGKVWGKVIDAGHASLATVVAIKYNNPAIAVGGSACQMADEMKPRGKHMMVFDSCNLTKGSSYQVYLYAEDLSNNGDGMLSQAISFSVPPSNWLDQVLELTSTPTTDGVSFSFAGGVAVGRAWAQVMLTKDVALATAADIKAATYAMGTGSCRQDDVNVGMSALYWTLTGCSLMPLVDYSVVLYVEDMGGLDDGQVSSVQMMVASSVSNYFVENPAPLGNVTSDGMILTFNAYASSGMAWGFVLEVGSANVASSKEAKLAQNSVGGAGCKPSEVPIDNSRQSMLFTDCDLVPGQTYRAVVYVEALVTTTAGVWQGVDISAPLLAPIEDPLARQHQDLQVQSGQDYVYHVRAVNFIGVGQPSPASVEIRAGNAPAAPGLPIIATRALTSLTVEWAPPAALGSQIMSYRLFMSGPLDGGVYQEIYNGPDTAYTKAMLDTGTVYFFRVSAVNHNGEGWRSAVREAAACVLPSMPSNFTVKSRSTLGVTVEWSPPIADGGCPILSYVVTQDGVLASTQTHHEYSLAVVVPAQTYTFSVWATSRVGNSPSTATLTVVAGEAPAKVINLEVVTMSASGITLTWDGVPSNLNGGVLRQCSGHWVLWSWATDFLYRAAAAAVAFLAIPAMQLPQLKPKHRTRSEPGAAPAFRRAPEETPAGGSFGHGDLCCEVDERGLPAKRPTVVLIHGLDSWSGTFQGLMEELARRGLKTLAVDLRGHGESPLGDPEDFSPQQLAADVRSTLKAAGLLESPVALVGHSMGGRIAMQYAADYPEDLSVLVIEDMDCVPRDYPKLEGEDLKKREAFTRDFPSWELAKKQLVTFGYDADRVDGWWTSATPRVYPRPPGVWSCINPYAQYLAKRTVLNSTQGYECIQKIAGLKMSGLAKFPVHVCVAGPSGTVCSWDKAPGGLHDMASVHPGLRLHTFPTADHSIHNTALKSFADLVEKPDEFAEVD
ncbi:Fndc3a [Symbiodinium natans]|uniref:Fndc3a protein n=1 Tax=Symbiodinium natans TaxID=878477 RepID=A0A812HY78_9DINO|nr:Fndc3a [Symbiodinium natans]